jgi:aminoglycoside phosphotransferase family enzyme/predicted kinase
MGDAYRAGALTLPAAIVRIFLRRGDSGQGKADLTSLGWFEYPGNSDQSDHGTTGRTDGMTSKTGPDISANRENQATRPSGVKTATLRPDAPSTPSASEAQQAEVLSALAEGTLFDTSPAGAGAGAGARVGVGVGVGVGAGARPQHIETHCSHIFLSGDRAFKLKRAIAFSYLDYQSLEARERCIKAEFALNRRTAPQLYLGCLKIIRTAPNRLALAPASDPAPALDWLVEMRRFADDALLADRADRGLLTVAQMRDLADAIHDFHEGAAERPDHGGAMEMARVLDECLDNMRLRVPPLRIAEIERLAEAMDQQISSHLSLIDRRRQVGRVRQCHGDLHLGNICLVDEKPVLFDCIDFSDMLACTDTAYDLAFLLMDLCHRKRVDFANLVLNRWLDRNGDAEALALLPFFQALRAAIRSHIVATTHRDDMARAYLASALSHLDPAKPKVIALGGFSGSGKSTLAAGLAPDFRPLPGARIIRSDTLRKRLAGIAPETRLPAESYTQQSSDAVYAAMQAEARTAISAGCSVIFDAAFLRAHERDAVSALAAELGAPFHGIWLDVPETVLRMRLAARSGDASDADTDVLARQLTLDPGPITWRRLAVAGERGQDLGALRLMLALA